MKVLIAAFDLFGSVGGGQTYYRNIILRNPSIEFHYFRQREPVNQPRCPNAHAVDFGEWYEAGNQAQFNLEVPYWAIGPFLWAQNMARSVAGMCFDVVDIPDYEQYGFFLRPAFCQFEVGADRLILTMHGAISTSIGMNWWANGESVHWLRQLELLQYSAVDQRCFYSAFYRDEWSSYSPLLAQRFDPMWFFDVPKPLAYRPVTELPVLRFIARIEKRKGPDLATNLAWWLPRSTYDRLEIIGPDCTNSDGQSAGPILAEMIRARNVPARLLPAQGHEEMARGYASRSVTLAPSTYDTLNILALESLFSGCPTVIGSGAGVCRYLQERFPELPFVRFDVEKFYSSVTSVEALLRNYEQRRTELNGALKQIDTRPIGPTLADIYRSEPSRDESAVEVAHRWHSRLIRSGHDSTRPRARVVAA
jgi:glycosyltransferase involved in cell wall biosynthesis